MSTFLEDLVNELGPEFASVASEGRSAAEISGFLNSGCYLLNAVVSGSIYKGFPGNKITAIAGEQATGKTFFALSIVKHRLVSDPKAQVVYFDTEGAITNDMLSDRGIDANRVLIVQSRTIQQFRTQTIKILEKYEAIKENERPPALFILDSMGMLSTTKEIEDTAEGKETRDMTKAQILKATFRVLTLELARLRVPLIVTNHVYDVVVGAYVPTKRMGGGSGLMYAASSILFLSKAKDRDGKDVVGNIIRVRMDKSRLSKENSSVQLKLSYATGLDKYYGLLDLAEKYGIIQKVTAQSYLLMDGSKVKTSTINNNPEQYFTKEFLDAIDGAANKEFMYGSSVITDEDEIDRGKDNNAA